MRHEGSRARCRTFVAPTTFLFDSSRTWEQQIPSLRTLLALGGAPASCCPRNLPTTWRCFEHQSRATVLYYTIQYIICYSIYYIVNYTGRAHLEGRARSTAIIPPSPWTSLCSYLYSVSRFTLQTSITKDTILVCSPSRRRRSTMLHCWISLSMYVCIYIYIYTISICSTIIIIMRVIVTLVI